MPAIYSHTRAQEDAEATLAVLVKLYEMASELPVQFASEIVRATQSVYWDAGYFFTQVLKDKARQMPVARKAQQKDYGVLFAQPEELLARPLKPNPVIEPLDPEETTAVLSQAGLFRIHAEF